MKPKCVFALLLPLSMFAAAHAWADSVRQPTNAPILVSTRVTTPPAIDGVGTEPAWRAAKELKVTANAAWGKKFGSSVPVSIRAAHSDTHVFFMVIWDDTTPSFSRHKAWTWDKSKETYAEGSEEEDMLAVAFELSGEFDANMLSGNEAVWDLWQWKAARTNPAGYAMDKTHRYTREKPEGKANMYTAMNGKPIWIARPEDAGDTLHKSLPKPDAYQADVVPQYVSANPSGSAADVEAKGSWKDGKWTVEFKRALNTGNPDDTPFDLSRSYKIAVAVQDNTGYMDKSTFVIRLQFAPVAH